MLSGQQIGGYRFEALIGSGGMGEVYRAHDAKLGRDVAVKVLPAIVSSDPDRLSRFEREARVLAALNNPAIASIYGFERDGDVTFLVMELVPGETLADVVHRGPVPITDALNIARQIADALDAAHQKGIVHRDLKPANVKITPEGRVKVLDFGLAKAVAPEDDPSIPSSSIAPTITTPAMTRAGVILGTAAYMAPEQARGKPVDKRVDIWAFGCVLFEMLTGRRLFASDEVSDTLAFILTKEPDWTLVPASTPASLQKLLRRCLEKDRAKRIADIADVRLEIDEALSAPAATVTAGRGAGRVRLLPLLPWAVAIIGIAATAALMRRSAGEATTPPVLRVSADIASGGAFDAASIHGTTLSNDGLMLAFVARPSSAPDTAPSVLFVRRLTDLIATMLPGTNGAANPFFSPDSTQIAFFADDKLKKTSASGGPVVALCNAPAGSRGGAWGPDGAIYFQPRLSVWEQGPLTRVSELGGAPEQLTSTATDDAALAQRWPQILPGGKAALTTRPAVSTQTSFNDAEIVIQPLPTGAPRVIQNGYFARYVPSGHLLYIRDGSLFAVPFDLDRLELAGAPVPVVEGVLSEPFIGLSTYSVSANGTLAYTAGTASADAQAPMLWLDRSGKTSTLLDKPSTWGYPRISPDGRRVAFVMNSGGNSDIWIYEWDRDTLTKFTTDPSNDSMPVWTPDGRRIVFSSNRADGKINNLYWKRADGLGQPERLTTSTNPQLPDSFHPDGRHLAFHEGNPSLGQQRLMILPLDGNEGDGWKPGQPTEFVGGAGRKALPEFSPDGKWIMYVSQASGPTEVYVRPYPGPGGQWQISSGGASEAHWSRTKPEIVFRSSVMGTPLRVARFTVDGDTFKAEKPVNWSETPLVAPPLASLSRLFDLHPNAERVITGVAAKADPQPRDRVVLVFNFFDELRRLARPK